MRETREKPVLSYEAVKPGGVAGGVLSVGGLSYTRSGLVWLGVCVFAGAVALALRDRSVGPVVSLMLKREGVSDAVMALSVQTLPLVVGMMLGPLAGWWSDRFRWRTMPGWGRRLPFLVVPVPVVIVALAGIALSGELGTWAAGALGVERQQGVLGVFLTCWVVYQVAVGASTGVLSGLVVDVVPKSVLGRFAAVTRSASLIAAIGFNYLLLAHAEGKMTAVLLGVGAVYLAGMVVLAVTVKEEPAAVRAVVDDGAHRPGMLAAVGGWGRECFGNPFLLLVFAVGTFGALTFVPIGVFNLFYAKQIGVPLGEVGAVVAGGAAVSLVLAYPLGSLADRWHPVRCGTVAMGLYAAAMAGWIALADTPGAYHVMLGITTVMSGCFLTTTASLVQVLLPREKFLQLASAGTAVTAGCQAAFGPTLGAALDATGNDYRLILWAALAMSGLTFGLIGLLWWAWTRRAGAPVA